MTTKNVYALSDKELYNLWDAYKDSTGVDERKVFEVVRQEIARRGIRNKETTDFDLLLDRMHIDQLNENIDKLRESLNWILHLHHGVSRGGGKDISNSEWEEALELAIKVLDETKS